MAENQRLLREPPPQTDLGDIEEFFKLGPEAALPQYLTDEFLASMVRDYVQWSKMKKEDQKETILSTMMVVAMLIPSLDRSPKAAHYFHKCHKHYAGLLMDEIFARAIGVYEPEVTLKSLFAKIPGRPKSC